MVDMLNSPKRCEKVACEQDYPDDQKCKFSPILFQQQ